MNDFKIGPERFITKADQVVLRPNWNLDGASLVLEVKSSAGSLLERCTLDGSPPTHLAPCNEGASIVQGRAAFFAKDDFAFVSDRGGRLSIWRADLSSGSVTPLTLPPPGASDYGPATAVGHEGRFLFFRKLEGHDGPYVFLGRAGAPDNVEQVTSVPGNQPWPLNGMDDMLFHAMRDDMDRVCRQAILSDGSIANVSAADEGLSYVTPFPSPDGSHIALATCIDALSQLVIMRSDGSGRQQVTAAPEPSMFPCWSPDGKALAFVRGNPLDQWRQAKLGERPAYTWGQAVASWLVKHADERRSIETMKDRLRWITGHLEHTPLTLITRDLVEDVMDLKIDEGIISKSRDPKKRPPPRPVAPKTLNNYVAEISKILHHAHALAWVDHVPALRKYEVGIAPINWLSQKQADRLLEELPLHLSVMAAFALATGLRESNVRLLCWDQVDLDNGMAWVEASSAKAKKPLGVPLNDDALMLLKAQQRLHPKWVFPYTPIAAGGEPGEPGPIAGCSSMAWYKAVKRAGLEGFRWHDLRHTWASWHVQAGTPLPILQELGGWSSFAMVQRYAHLGRNHTAAYANAVSRYNGGTSFGTKHADEAQALDSMGWLMGLEPTTTGITTRDSTN